MHRDTDWGISQLGRTYSTDSNAIYIYKSIEKNTLSAEIQTTLMSWIQSTILSLDSQHNLVAYNYSGKRKGDMLDFWI